MLLRYSVLCECRLKKYFWTMSVQPMKSIYVSVDDFQIFFVAKLSANKTALWHANFLLFAQIAEKTLSPIIRILSYCCRFVLCMSVNHKFKQSIRLPCSAIVISAQMTSSIP